MRYLIRAIKYFFYFSILTSVFLAALVFVNAVDGNIQTMFRDGWNAVWKIALMFAAVAAVYPKVGFIRREAVTAAAWSDIREDFIGFMEDKGYTLESEDGSTATFRLKNVAGKITRMLEDRVTVKTGTDGIVELEGLRKDVLRLAMGIETRFRSKD